MLCISASNCEMFSQFLHLQFRFVNFILAVLLTISLVPCVLPLYPDILNVSAEQVFYLLNKTRILGDVIQKAPKYTCMVSYFENTAVELGNVLEAKLIRYPPHWCRWTGEESSYYTFLVTGPDEPSREHPVEGEYIHWLIGNIKGDKILQEKEYIYEYIGPDPKKGTGKHRVVYLVFKQPDGKLKFDEPRLNDSTRENPRRSRKNFSCGKFAKKYNLGDPVAANFLYVEWGLNKSRVIPPWSMGGKVTLPTHPDYVWDPEENMPWFLSKKDLEKPVTPEPF